MKIIIISPFYTPSMGGVEAIVKQTAEALAQRNNDVTVITTNYSNSWVKLSEPHISEENGVSVHRLKPGFKVGFACFMDHLPDLIQKETPDVVHCHNLHPHLFQAIRAKTDCQFKLVAQLHFPGATGIDGFGAKLAYPIATSLLQKHQQKIDAFIIHSNLEKKWLVGKGFDEEKMRRLNYPCVSSQFLKLSNAYLGDGKNAFGRFSHPDLLYIGRMSRRKGLHTFLQALPSVIADIKDLTVILAGPSDEKYCKRLLSLAKQLNLGNHVRFSQALTEEAKRTAITECKVFVVPSIKDYTPVTLIEAQALGKPVISTTTGAIPEIVNDSETGLLVEPQNPEALAEAIKFLLSVKQKRQAMGERALEWVQNNFLLNDVIVDLERLYNDCIVK